MSEDLNEQPIETTPAETIAPEQVNETVATEPTIEINLFENLKNIHTQIKNKQYFAAIGTTCTLGLNGYKKYLKGKTVSIKGKDVPLTAVVLVALFGLYTLTPSCSSDTVVPEKPAIKEVQKPVKKVETSFEENIYDKDGVKVYDLKKCDEGVCGLLENGSETKYAKVTVSVSFKDDQGDVVYEGGIVAEDVEGMSRMSLSIPAEVEFESFTLSKVELEQ